MKKYLFLFLIVVLAAFMYSADVYNRDDGYLNIVENFSSVVVQYDVTLGSDSTGSQHSRPIYIADMNDNDAYVAAVTNAASDVNIIVHYSYNLRTWTSVTKNNLDAVSTTTLFDTLGDGATNDFQFHRANWLVIEADGQAGANQTDIIYITAVFKKDVAGYTSSGVPIKVVRKGTATTNP